MTAWLLKTAFIILTSLNKYNEIEETIKSLGKNTCASSWVVFPNISGAFALRVLLQPLYLASVKAVGHHQCIQCQNLIQCEHRNCEHFEFWQGIVTPRSFYISIPVGCSIKLATDLKRSKIWTTEKPTDTSITVTT